MMLMAQDSVSVVPDSQITKSSDDTCTVKWGEACYHGAIVASDAELSLQSSVLNKSETALPSSRGTASNTLKPDSPCWKNCIIQTNDFEFIPPEERYTLSNIIADYGFGSAMKYQLTRDVAMQCLPDLADGIREGLDKLHGLGLAHLDVRLPNVCVGDDYEVKLIDFDRSSRSNDVKEYGGQFMYKYETKQRIVQHLDWKQFGLLLFTLSSYIGPKHQNELTKDDIPQESSSFLRELIFDHTYAHLSDGDRLATLDVFPLMRIDLFKMPTSPMGINW
ncbi:hypothetical protein EMCRGX_G015037 [Ephydatia muelleri]